QAGQVRDRHREHDARVRVARVIEPGQPGGCAPGRRKLARTDPGWERERMQPETVYSSALSPNPASALDVLAFILTPPEVFAPAADDEELAAVAELLGSAKAEAIRRWQDLRSDARVN